MSKFIYGSKLYDTDKATLVKKWWEDSQYNNLYVTKKGNWFVSNENIYYTLDLFQVKKLAKENCWIDVYENYFGKLEEA